MNITIRAALSAAALLIAATAVGCSAAQGTADQGAGLGRTIPPTTRAELSDSAEPSPSGIGSSSAISYAYTGEPKTLTVPDGVTAVSVTIVGASGGSANKHGNTLGGLGTKLSGTLPVTAGQTLTIAVGGAGGDNDGNSQPGRAGWSSSAAPAGGGGHSKGKDQVDGAGGGGATVISIDGVTVLIAAGGGGAGTSADPGSFVSGGNGGGAQGTNGIQASDLTSGSRGASGTSSYDPQGGNPVKSGWNAAGLGDGGGGGGGGLRAGEGGWSGGFWGSSGGGGGGNSLYSQLTGANVGKGARGNGSATLTFLGP